MCIQLNKQMIWCILWSTESDIFWFLYFLSASNRPTFSFECLRRRSSQDNAPPSPSCTALPLHLVQQQVHVYAHIYLFWCMNLQYCQLSWCKSVWPPRAVPNIQHLHPLSLINYHDIWTAPSGNGGGWSWCQQNSLSVSNKVAAILGHASCLTYQPWLLALLHTAHTGLVANSEINRPCSI